MKVLVAGATGAIGRRLLPRLVKAGHSVVALTREPGRLSSLEGEVRAVQADVLAREGLDDIAREVRPDAVISELSDLPRQLDIRRLADAYAANNRVRREGTRNLLDAAVAAGASRAVVQSVAAWYKPNGRTARHEDAPLFLNAPEPVGEAVRVLKAMEDDAFALPLDVVILRYGVLYGPGTWYAPGGAIWEEVRQRRLPIIGEGQGFYSFIHVDDAAEATVAALERGAPGIYNVVDDEPAPARDWLPIYAAAIVAATPMTLPRSVVHLALGGFVDWERSIPAVSNAKLKRDLGWTAQYPSWRTGFKSALA